MPHNAFVFGDLSWPMPDPGLIAVWRAMAIDASRWDDWSGFVEQLRTGTIGALVDDVAARPMPSSLQLEITDTGVRLRACLDDAHADDWQRLAIAWRLAADLGASGEFAWTPCERGPQDVAYHAVIRDYDSRWEMLRGASTSAIEGMAGRREVAALAGAAPERATAKPAKKAAAKSTSAKKSGKNKR
jgi:hypothetical protein